MRKKIYFINIGCVIVCLILICVIFFNIFHISKLQNNLYSPNATTFYVTSSDKTIDILEATPGSATIFFEFEPFLRAMYSENTYYTLPLKEGKFFSLNDLRSKERKAIIGSSYLNFVETINNKQYINLFGTSFEVIGIFKDNLSKQMDTLVLINLSSIIDNLNSDGIWVVENRHSTLSDKSFSKVLDRELIGLSRFFTTSEIQLILSCIFIATVLLIMYLLISMLQNTKEK